jgi:hypothetical protein
MHVEAVLLVCVCLAVFRPVLFPIADQSIIQLPVIAEANGKAYPSDSIGFSFGRLAPPSVSLCQFA